MRFRWTLLFLTLSSVMFISCAEVKQVGRDIGHGTRDAVKEVGKETKQILNDED